MMLLADGEAEVPKSFNIFKNKLLNTARIQKIFKRYPFVPEVGDMSITLSFILARAPHYEPESTPHNWVGDSDRTTAQQYLLSSSWSTFRELHSEWTARFTSLVNAIDPLSFDKTAADPEAWPPFMALVG